MKDVKPSKNLETVLESVPPPRRWPFSQLQNRTCGRLNPALTAAMVHEQLQSLDELGERMAGSLEVYLCTLPPCSLTLKKHNWRSDFLLDRPRRFHACRVTHSAGTQRRPVSSPLKYPH
jgi:hypothetical protein